MPFDPTKPANNSPINSPELRSQFTSLKAEIDDRVTGNNLIDYVGDNTAAPVGAVAPLALIASNPPTQTQLQQVIDK
ncbi:MAG: hypothetical protein EPO07_14015, partial [Verrucomicrobia bacterium]